jgi:hypothetical protein
MMKKVKIVSAIICGIIPWLAVVLGVTSCGPAKGTLCVDLKYKCYGDCHCDTYTIKVTVVDGNMNTHIAEYDQYYGEVPQVCFDNLPVGKGVQFWVDMYCEGAKIHDNVSDFCSRRMQGYGNSGMPADKGVEASVDLNCI